MSIEPQNASSSLVLQVQDLDEISQEPWPPEKQTEGKREVGKSIALQTGLIIRMARNGKNWGP